MPLVDYHCLRHACLYGRHIFNWHISQKGRRRRRIRRIIEMQKLLRIVSSSRLVRFPT